MSVLFEDGGAGALELGEDGGESRHLIVNDVETGGGSGGGQGNRLLAVLDQVKSFPAGDAWEGDLGQ